METFFLFVLAGSVALIMTTLGALVCAGEHGTSVEETLRQTFMPLTMREFALPPCPFCWFVRVTALTLLIGAVVV